MAILWSSLSNGQSIAFNPLNDVLDFQNIPGSSASQLFLSYPSGSSVTLTYAGRSVTLQTSAYSLDFSNFTFSDGGRLTFGETGDSMDTLTGTAFNDLLDGGIGWDEMSGGAGNDVYVTDSQFDLVIENPGEGTDWVRTTSPGYTLMDNVENLRLVRSDGVGYLGIGNGLGNIIAGNSGGDSIDGAGGADVMAGGLGNDLYGVDNPGDIVMELANSGFDTVFSTISYDLMSAWHVEGLRLSGSANINGSGNWQDNFIEGNSGSNLLSGSLGNDTLSGGFGGVEVDTLAGGFGNDLYLFEETLGDVIVERAGQGSDTLALFNEGSPLVLDLAGVAMSSIETIDLSGGGNTLVLTTADLSALAPDGAVLRVAGEAADSVSGGSGWFFDGVVNSGGQDYERFSQGSVSLHVDSDIRRALDFSINLSSLDGSNGFEINGEAGNGMAGQAVASAGDFNGDGYADVLIGAYNRNPGVLESAGSNYIVFGGASGFAANLNLSALNGSNGFEITGETAFDWSGKAVSAAGDINGDSYADIIIGAGLRDAGGTNAGAAYVVFGKASGFAADLSLSGLDGRNGFEINGEAAFDVAGVSVSGAGDVNGDGYGDLLVGAFGRDINGSAAGASYVVFGKAAGFSPNLNLSALDGSNGFEINGEAAADYAGRSVSAAGDVNGDGFADLLIGATGRDALFSNGGSAYVVFGKATGFSANLNLSSLNGSNGFEIPGRWPNDQAGWSVAGAGDFNGDGFSDIALSANLRDMNAYESGSTYVIYGKASGFSADFSLSSLDGTNGFQVSGESAGDQSGFSISGAGDVNGDGYADLLIGVPFRDSGGVDAGAAYVVFGGGGFGPNLDLSSLNTFGGVAGFAINGEAAGDTAGRSVSGAGDVNGDGYDDLLIGADRRDVNGASAGAAYVLFGHDFRQDVDVRGTSGNDSLAGTGAGEILIGGLGNDTIDGGAGNDVIKGAAGDDVIFYDVADYRVEGGSGFDRLVLTGTGSNLDLTAAAEARVSGFERLDLTGSGANSATIDIAGLFAITDAPQSFFLAGMTRGFSNVHAFWVDGDANDTFTATGNGWVYQGVGVANSVGYDVYSQGAAVLLVDVDVNANVGLLSVPLSSLDGVNGFMLTGETAGDELARSVSAAGDFNGDGYGDFLVGVENRDAGFTNAGAAYLVFGKASGWAGSFNASTLDGSNGFEINGESLSAFTGRSVSGAGDVNGDGFGDILLGADGRSAGAGSTYVIFGAASGFSANLNVSTLDGSTGYEIAGETAGDGAGRSVSGAGDINGDGYADLLIGAPFRVGSTGSSYVVFGKASGYSPTFNLSALDGSNGFEIVGEASPDASGISVSDAGDINGDGFADVLIGAYGSVANGNASGAAYVVFGKASGFSATVNLSGLNGTDGFRLTGSEGHFLGRSVSSTGDVNGDGFDDLLIGAYGADADNSYAGASYVVFGKASGFASSVNVSTLTGANGFKISGESNDDLAGFSVSGAGDIDGDGYADLLIGAWGNDVNGTQSGSSYVVFGQAGGFAANIDLSALSGRDGFKMAGAAFGDQSGRTVSTAGDVNGDGFDDLLVGASLNDAAGNGAGAGYVIFGRDFRGEVDYLGGDGNDSLTGGVLADVLVGGRGNDTLDGYGGADVVKGGAGDDVLVWQASSDSRMFDGGAGTDTLWFENSISLVQPDFDYRYGGIEVVDMSGSFSNTLTVTLADVLNLSDTSNTLRVLGNANDTLESTGQGWVAGSTVDIGGTLYQSYTSGAATLLADTDLILNIS